MQGAANVSFVVLALASISNALLSPLDEDGIPIPRRTWAGVTIKPAQIKPPTLLLELEDTKTAQQEVEDRLDAMDFPHAQKSSSDNIGPEDQLEDELKHVRFLEWLRGPSKITGLDKLEITTVGNHRGTVAVEDISENEIFIVVPPDSMMSANLTSSHEVEEALDIFNADIFKEENVNGSLFLYTDGDINLHRRLALKLLLEHKKGASSFWAPYIEILPKYFTRPQDYSSEEFAELKGTSVVPELNDVIRAYKAEFGLLFPMKGDFPEEMTNVSFAEWIWARDIVMTRCFSTSHYGADDIALVPLADLPNHENVRVSWACDEDGTFSMITMNTSFSKGEEIFISYGQHNNAHLLMYYGFMLPANPNKIPNPCEKYVNASKSTYASCIKETLDKYSSSAVDDIEKLSTSFHSASFNMVNAWRLRLEEKEDLLGLKHFDMMKLEKRL